MAEEWEVIPSYPNYEASTDGRIRRWYTGQGATPDHILKPYINESGYAEVDLYEDGERYRQKVHELVAETYFSEARQDSSLPINHINGDRTDNRVSNLEVVTAAENVVRDVSRRQKAGTYINPAAKLSEQDRVEIKLLYTQGFTQEDIANGYGVSQSTVSEVVNS
jgi:predicted XRE-type DNA-binding protein